MRKRGFTLIELIVVMAIIAILVLLGVPKYKEYTKEAHLTKIKVNVKELESASMQYYMKYNDWPRLKDEPYTAEQIEDFGKKILDKTGAVVVLEEDGKYYDIDFAKITNYVKVPEDNVNYILQNPVGRVFFIEGITEDGKERVASESIDNKIPNYYVLATDSDFSGTTNGNFKYIGTDEYVIVPHIIKGIPVTSYSYMFDSTSVKGVVSTNSNVNNMNRMFYNSNATTLDLSNFDTSNVTKMGFMFSLSKVTTLDLSSFDTSKVTDMQRMFQTSSVKNLDLSSFDTTNVIAMYDMFYQSNTTTCYVRNSSDLNKFNKSGNLPSGLTFIIK